MTSPMITALMTTFNAERFVEETIKSVLAQTYQNFEFLIIDDGSTDKTCEIVKSFDDNRIRFLEYPDNKGVGFRLSKAFELIKTPYIVKVDADDISLPSRFQVQYDYLITNPEVGLVKCYIDYFADSESILDSSRFLYMKNQKEVEINSINTPDKIRENLKRWLCIPHTTYMAKTVSVKKAGYPASRMFEDYHLFYKMLEQGCIFSCVPEKLVRFRVSDCSTTVNPEIKYIDMGIEVIVNFKMPKIQELLKNRKLNIFGSGQLAQSLSRVLKNKNIDVDAFLERKTIVREKLDGIPVHSIENNFPDKNSVVVIIAAQPAREEIYQLFLDNGWVEWDDFLVIA